MIFTGGDGSPRVNEEASFNVAADNVVKPDGAAGLYCLRSLPVKPRNITATYSALKIARLVSAGVQQGRPNPGCDGVDGTQAWFQVHSVDPTTPGYPENPPDEDAVYLVLN